MAWEKYYQFDNISKINTYLRIISTQIIIAFFSFLHLFTDLGHWSGYIFLSLVVIIQLIATLRGKKVFWRFLNLNIKKYLFTSPELLKILFALILIFYHNDILYGAVLFIIFNEFLRYLYNQLYDYAIIEKQQSATHITINTPGDIAGNYGKAMLGNKFGSKIISVITADLVIANDSSSNPSEGCKEFGADVSGKIALIRRGSCDFTLKVKNAQDNGAIAAIIINNTSGSPTSMEGKDDSITIPAVMISKVDGDLIEAALALGVVNASLHPLTTGFTASLLPENQYTETRKIKLIKANKIATFDFVEFIILLLALGLPFQEFIVIDLKLITFLIFSIYSLNFLYLISNTLYNQIYRLLNQSLKVFFIIICFLFIISTQLKNLYSEEYPTFFNDFYSTLRNLINIITGNIFSELNNNDTGLLALSFILFCFVGIILFTIFTAIMVDTTIENHKDKNFLIGLYDGGYIKCFEVKDKTGKWYFVNRVKHKEKYYFNDIEDDEIIDPSLPQFNIEDAYELIISKNGVKGIE